MSGNGVEGLAISSAGATWGMIILFVILVIVIFFFCCVPVYKALQARYTHWDDPENDPRWNIDQFQFSPTSPRADPKAASNKYNRLSVCSAQTVSRGSSFRNTCALPRMEDQVEIKMPPAYTDIFNPGSGDVSSLGTPPAYYSRSPSDVEVVKETAADQPPAATATAPATTAAAATCEEPNQTSAAGPAKDQLQPPSKPRKTYKKNKKAPA